MIKKSSLIILFMTMIYSLNVTAQDAPKVFVKNTTASIYKYSKNINKKTIKSESSEMDKKNGPASSLTPFVLSHQKALKLTITQKEKIFKWLQQQKEIIKSNMPSFLVDSEALNKALMNKESTSEINILKKQVMSDQKDMLNQNIQQIEFYQKLLTDVQWKKLRTVYNN